MLNLSVERRGLPRYLFELPIVVTEIDGGRELQGLTRDISRTGAFFYAREQPPTGSAVQFRMVMPSEIILGQDRRVAGRGTVLRVEFTESGVGVALRIDTDISA